MNQQKNNQPPKKQQRSKKLTKAQLKTSKQLAIVAAVCLLSLYALFLLTKQAAQNSEKHHLETSLAKVLPEHSFDNNLLATRNQQAEMIVYQACQHSQPKYQIYEIRTDKGYSGLIKLLLSVDLDKKRIIQVRPLFHQETPGLGDQIDVDKSPWLQQFALPLSTPANHIAVKQDEGKIDAITGATITSRAVSDAIAQALFARPLIILPNHCETP